jgi:23S rRNA pseudouridine1911/1915/1917 synthase
MNQGFEARRILYHDGDCVVVNKVPGEAVEGAGPGMAELRDLLLKGVPDLSGSSFLQPVHRLDVPVSGCVLFAKNPGALTLLGGAFARGEAVKKYWALIEDPPGGLTLPGEAELTHWLSFDPKSNKSRAFAGPAGGRKKAVLKYRFMGCGDRYLFMEIDLISGRHHQIRAQLAALGLHIKGDLKYGSRRSEKDGGIRLHAFFLSFPCPAEPERRVSVTALPPRLDPLWQALVEAASTGPLN